MVSSTKRSFFHQAQFLQSAPSIREAPADAGFEVAFAGRSNAGKSSAINLLTGNSKLARISKTPGRTQLLNFFSLTDSCRLVDLPGYGFAKVPLQVKRLWEQHLTEYLEDRQSLKGVVLLMDIRHPLQPFDLSFLNWSVAARMPVHVLLTKSDKLNRGPMQATVLKVQNDIRHTFGDIPISVQAFSALKGDGVDTLMKQLCLWLLPEDSTKKSPAEELG